jgi:4-amino-4-deoxy-L-arabinose transferase-like glycosyltransferase
MGKSDRALFIGLLCIFLFFTIEVYHFLNYVLIFTIVLMMISSYLRLINAINK